MDVSRGMFRAHEGTTRLIIADEEASAVEGVTVLFGFVTNLGQIPFSFLSESTLYSLISCSPVASMSYEDS